MNEISLKMSCHLILAPTFLTIKKPKEKEIPEINFSLKFKLYLNITKKLLKFDYGTNFDFDIEVKIIFQSRTYF